MPAPNVNGFSRHDWEPFGSKRDFRHGSKGDLTAPKSNFRSSPESGLNSDNAPSPFRANKRHNAITSSARVSEVDGELGAVPF
jgi:hypothetical protein